MNKTGSLVGLINALANRDVEPDRIWSALRGAINPALLISNMAEIFRIPASETEELLTEHGLGDLVAQYRLERSSQPDDEQTYREYLWASSEPHEPFRDLFSTHFSPSVNEPIRLPSAPSSAIELLMNSVRKSLATDPFLSLYRQGVLEYHDEFLTKDARLIDSYVEENFKGSYPRYVVNSGIGANEQFNHLVAHFNNADERRRVTWIITDSPRELSKLPAEVDLNNTLFLEFSRSGKTEETVKIHEYTPRDAKRIVFANSGPLRDIGLRDHNLVLDLPDEVSGRFGRNKTPILLAPMYVARMDTKAFWQEIDNSIRQFDLTRVGCLPILMAEFIYLYQQQRGTNHIYLGCNDNALRLSGDELLQFWNEGVNKHGNDISMSAYFGLLRDSHATIEGMLGNHETKIALFLLYDTRGCPTPPLTRREIDPINTEHTGLEYGDEEEILAEANYQRFAEMMPCIKLAVHRPLSLRHAAVLGQLWADTTFVYSKLTNVDPGSNPEVKSVRDRAGQLLAQAAQRSWALKSDQRFL